MNGLEDADQGFVAVERRRATGTIGVIVAIAVGLILGMHPLGSSDLYDDGPRFTHHVGYFWVTIHFVGAILLLAVPAVIAASSATLVTPAAHALGGRDLSVGRRCHPRRAPSGGYRHDDVSRL